MAPLSIPIVTDEDIAWIAEIMELDGLDPARINFLKRHGTFDVSACPGSGKTTLVVAKLAIMAKKWAYKTSGICVLSHTNVAREEIQKKLGHTPVGHRLLSYPHFIDTIHTFANRFLALPYLQSNNYPSPLIDDDVAKAFRRTVLPAQERWKYEAWLKRRHASIDDITFSDKDFSVLLGGRVFPTPAHTQTYQKAKTIVEASARAGRFKYEEMFVWAEHLLETYPEISAALSHRFPLVLMDEMQDTSQRQAAFLSSIFDRGIALCSIQRVGDPNQEIFKTGSDRNVADPFPDLAQDRTITVASSRRFGAKIAELANPHAVLPIVGGLIGGGPCKAAELADHDRNIIIVFPDDDATGVLDQFGKHLLASFDDETLRLGRTMAIGGVHKPSGDIVPGHDKYPMSVEHYWADYSSEKSKSERHPQTLIGCLHQAQTLVRDGSEIGAAIAVFVSGLNRLARDIGTPKDELGRRRKHKIIRTILENSPEALAYYDGFIETYITMRNPISPELWDTHKPEFHLISQELCQGETKLANGRSFLRWEDPHAMPPVDLGGSNVEDNVCKITSGDREISIALGSIHQAKGQTHFATLLLSTFQNNHSSNKILPWLTNESSSGAGQGVQNLSRLKRTYVALTRPTHLVAVAVRESALGTQRQEALEKLEQNGWVIKDICS